MEKRIEIDSQKCIKCSKCIQVCPSGTLVSADDRRAEVSDVSTCIVCGHCVAVCESAAICHSLFPADKVHTVDYSLYPSVDQMMMLMKSRRSNRALSSKPVPAELLDLIAEAAHRAPTASNQQCVAFTIVTDPEKLRVISDFTMNTFGRMLKTVKNPFVKPLIKVFMPDAIRYIPIFEKMQLEYANGRDGVLRGATAVLFIHSPRGSRFGAEDCNLAYQNGSLMAECLGVSQFYTGFVLNAVRQNKRGDLERALGISGQIYAGMALGMPKFRYHSYIDRNDMDITTI